MKKKKLEVFNLLTKNDSIVYNNYLNKINTQNPFYNVDLLEINIDPSYELKYFVFFQNDAPCVLMVFYLRSIIGDLIGSTSYYDVVSPYSYSGPLFNESTTNETIIDFWDAVNQWYISNNVISEFIRFSLNNNHIHYNGLVQHTLNNVKGEIIEEENQWENFKSKVRNNYRKAVQENLSSSIRYKNITPTEIKEFYDIYISTMHRHTAEKLFFHTLKYFTNFIVNNPDKCVLILVYKEGKAISTELVLLFNDTMYSFLGGTLSDYFYTRPNDFLKIEAINWGRSNGFKCYILGGGRKDNDRLYTYKKNFFPKDDDVVFYTGRKILNQDIYADLCKKNEANIKNHEIDFFPLYRYKE